MIASTDYYWDHAEERRLTGVAGETVTLHKPLNYLHWGTLQEFPNNNLAGITLLD